MLCSMQKQMEEKLDKSLKFVTHLTSKLQITEFQFWDTLFLRYWNICGLTSSLRCKV